MTRDETIALFLQGRKAWNAWAEAMLAERKALEGAGEWAAGTDIFSGRLEGNNDQTRDWIARAFVDLSRCRVFQAGAEVSSLRGADAPQQASDRHGDDLDRHGADAPRDDDESDGLITIEVTDRFDCSGFIFPANAGFYSAQFHALANFQSARFQALANFFRAEFHTLPIFDRAQFHADASFHSAQFHALAYFGNAQFHAPANFHNAQFHADASFQSAQFHAYASFYSAQFHALAFFCSASFAAATSFRDAAFGTADKPADADFTGSKVERAFDLTGATFSRVPSFNQADFVQPPDLDDVSYPISGFWQRGQRDDIPRYRHIRRIALGGHNHDAEAMAFKGETRAKRFTEHGWLSLALYAGMFYDAVSDFGRSIVWPLLVWLFSIPFFVLIYLWNAGKLSQLVGACEGAAYWGKALLFALKNALLIVSWDFAQINSAYSCLYGVELQGSLNAVPAGNAVIQGVQSVFSAVVLFLLLLGVRNQFKIK